MSASMGSDLERAFETQLKALGAPPFEMEYRFDSKRRWRWDFCWPQYMIAVEIEGGTWMNGGHSRGAGYARDLVKYNKASMDDWRVLRYDTDMVNDWSAAREVVAYLSGFVGDQGQ